MPLDATAPRVDARRRLRSRRLLAGKIVSRDGGFSCECLVREISETGARIETPSEVLFPLRFYLIGAKLPEAYDSEVVWTRGNKTGLKFHRALDLSAEATPLFLRRLHCELRPRSSP